MSFGEEAEVGTMALMKCPEPECGRSVSTRAEFCPHCGCPLDKATPSPPEAEQDLDLDLGLMSSGFPSVGGSARPTVHLKVAPAQALALIRRIPHSKGQKAVPNNWHVDGSGNATPESVDWLYCWAKRG